MRYLIIKNGEGSLFVWDSKKEQMYHSVDGECFEEVKGNLVGLSKFVPHAKILEETETKPAGINKPRKVW